MVSYQSRSYSLCNTVNKTFSKQPPLLSGGGHLLAVPIRFLLLFIPLFRDRSFFYQIGGAGGIERGGGGMKKKWP